MKYLLRVAVIGFLFVLTTAPAAAHASLVRSDPAPNSVLPSAPPSLTLWFDEELDPLYSSVSLLDAGGARVDANHVTFDAGHKRMLADVQAALPRGAYTVAWRALSAADGHLTRGAYVIYIGTLSAPPVLLNQASSEGNALPLPFEIVVRWLNLLAALSLCGALVLSLLLADASPAFALARRRTARRMRLVLIAVLLVLFVGTIFGVLLQAAAASERSLVDVVAQSIWLHSLTATRFGQAGLVRIVLVDLLLVMIASGHSATSAVHRGAEGGARSASGHSASRDMRRGAKGGEPLASGHSTSSDVCRGAEGGEPLAGGHSTSSDVRRGAKGGEPLASDGFRIASLWNLRLSDLLYAVLGALILLTFSLGSHAAAADDTLELGLFADWLHLLAIGAWTGGLIALAVVMPRGPAGSEAEVPAGVLLTVLRRFSRLALIAVVLLGLTGLYTAWRQVGSAGALVSTAYGLTLVIKNLTLLPLLLLGLLNTLILRPDLAARGIAALGRWHIGGARRAGEWLARLAERSPQQAILPLVRAEALLGALVVLAAATLTALPPARSVAAAPPPPPFRVTRQTSDLSVTLTVDPYVVSSNQTYDVLIAAVPGGTAADVTGVSLRFALLSADLGSVTQPMQPAGGAHFRLQGGYLSAVGAWNVEVIIARSGVPEDARVPFRLQLTDPATQPAAEIPPISSSLWFAFFDLAAGIGLMVYSQRRHMTEGKWIGAGAVGLGIVLFLMATVLAPPATAGSLANPVVADAGSLARGGALYTAHCAVCHGADGRGNGPLAPSLNPRPSDFVQHVNFHTDDVLFEWISKGIPGTAMQGWEGTLTETDRWNVLNYIQALVERAAATPTPAK